MDFEAVQADRGKTGDCADDPDRFAIGDGAAGAADAAGLGRSGAADSAGGRGTAAADPAG